MFTPGTSWHIIALAGTVVLHSIPNSLAFSYTSTLSTIPPSTSTVSIRRRNFLLSPRVSTILQSTSESIHNDNNPSQSKSKPSSDTDKPQKKKWFPVKPEDALLTNYDTLVKGAYVRHVLLETEDMGQIAMQAYLKGDISSFDDDDKLDPFGKLARDLSACAKSREEGGKIGWIDNPFHPSFAQQDGPLSSLSLPLTLTNEIVSGLISQKVIEDLFKSRPKGGDILKLSDRNEEKYHLCRIDDLLLDYVQDSKSDDVINEQERTLQFKQRGVNKVITKRSKLKGLGTTPLAPMFITEANADDGTGEAQGYHAKTYHIATSGCQMNVADSERLAGILENNLKLKVAVKPGKADVVILNTCSIRDHAEQKVYDALGPYAARKRRGEPLALIVSGCVAQQEGEALLKRVPEVDLVMGPQYVSRLADLLDDVSRGHQVVATDPTLLSEDMSRPVRGHDVRAWVNVINGCNEHCTYCVVPGVRGVEQSRPMESVLKECLDLADAGYKEVTLLGQNIDAYGRDLSPKRTFADLLHYLNDAMPEGSIERIRYVTSHPRYFSDRVIDAVASLDKVCECFHMPFQSGGDEVLKNMRRGYTFDSYMKIINKIKVQSPDAAICGDVIVGFPGETDEQFQRTLDLMTEVKFDNLNTFAYSPRPNTEAALWDNQIPDDVKSERLQMVQRLAAEHGMEKSLRYVGKTVEVLVEGRNPRNNDQVMGRTRQSRQVFFNGNIEELKGTLVDVNIVEARTWSLVGEAI